jgi:Na+/proline symporter
MLTVFLYARLWRRAGVMTDIEFAELRYSGKPAAFLRGFRALYLGLPINCIILGWVNLAMVKIIEITLGLEKRGAILVVIGMLLFTAFYTAISGLWGVLVTDLFQFVLKMGMVIVLAILAVNAVGGIDSLKTKINAMDAASGQVGSRLAFFPDYDSRVDAGDYSLCFPGCQLVGELVSGRGTRWWWYVAQRIFSAKNEKHGLPLHFGSTSLIMLCVRGPGF